jgi:hypothetical protein
MRGNNIEVYRIKILFVHLIFKLEKHCKILDQYKQKKMSILYTSEVVEPFTANLFMKEFELFHGFIT